MYEICAIIKDEQEYLKEWLDYHFSLGFDKIYLYQDYGSKSHSSITDQYNNVILTEVQDLGIQNYGTSMTQYEVYNYHLQNTKADWLLLIDIDEFLMFDKGYDLDKLTQEFKDYNGIWLSWLLYSANGHINKPLGKVMDNYTKPVDNGCYCDKNPQWNFKSFVNVNKTRNLLTIHAVEGGVHTDFNDDILGNQCYSKAWINHYFCKSWEDYCNRMLKRGNMSNDYRTFDTFFLCNPDMVSIKEQLIDSIRNKHTVSTFWISKDLGIISGGNLDLIKNIKIR